MWVHVTFENAFISQRKPGQNVLSLQCMTSTKHLLVNEIPTTVVVVALFKDSDVFPVGSAEDPKFRYVGFQEDLWYRGKSLGTLGF